MRFISKHYKYNHFYGVHHWFKRNKRNTPFYFHKENSPAVVDYTGYKYFYLNGNLISEN